MALSKRQENELWNLRETLAHPIHDDGKPYTLEEVEETRNLILCLEMLQ